jgi:hypothetical protein
MAVSVAGEMAGMWMSINPYIIAKKLYLRKGRDLEKIMK